MNTSFPNHKPADQNARIATLEKQQAGQKAKPAGKTATSGRSVTDDELRAFMEGKWSRAQKSFPFPTRLL